MLITTDPDELAPLLTWRSRLLGLDLGASTIGLATGTLDVGIATPLTTIRRTRFRQDAANLMALVARENIAALVLGLPLNMDGSEGSRAQSTRAFVRNLAPFAPPPILLFDERLTSAAANDGMKEAGLSRRNREAMIDAAAAAIILQDALDRLRSAAPIKPVD
jgi:putative Holliday junction resolvase